MYVHNKEGECQNQTLIPRDVWISTQAHVGDGETQYFTWGELVEMIDNIELGSLNLQGEYVGIQGYLFHELADGTIGMSFISEKLDVLITDDLLELLNAFATYIDTAEYSDDVARWFWGERVYTREVDVDGEYYWYRRYEHNFDGSDENQTITPIRAQLELPQTGTNGLTAWWKLGVGALGLAAVGVYVKKKNSYTKVG